MKRIVTIITSTALFGMLCCSCSNSTSFADTEFISTLENTLIVRQSLVDNDSDTLEYFRELVSSEIAIFDFSEKNYKDSHLKELAVNYINGLKKQQEALEYYSDVEKFNELWEEGYIERSKSAIALMESYNLNIPDDTKIAFQKNVNTTKKASETAGDTLSIQKTLFNTLPQETINLLYSGELSDVVCTISNGKANISVRVLEDFCIPTVAKEIWPLVLSTLDEHCYYLGSLTIKSYRNNNSGLIADSLVSWETQDGQTGLFQIISKKYIKPNYAISDMENYYSDYKEVIEKIKAGI